jgi:hypothetical protein
MAYLNSRPATSKETFVTISNATLINQNSVKHTVYTDYPQCFERSTIHSGLILSGEYPGNIPFNLDKLTKEWLDSKRVSDEEDRKLKAEYFQAGWQAVKVTLNDETVQKLMALMRKDEPATFGEIKDIYNTAQMLVVLCKVLRSDDREAAFRRNVSGTDPTIDKIIRRGK